MLNVAYLYQARPHSVIDKSNEGGVLHWIGSLRFIHSTKGSSIQLSLLTYYYYLLVLLTTIAEDGMFSVPDSAMLMTLN